MSDSLSNNKISYFSKECFDCLKGYFALFVLMHHTYQFTGIFSDTKLAIIFSNLGYWSVAVFIFISGFGLYESYKKKGDSYLKDFPFKRILSFYFIYCIFAFSYIIYDLCMGVKHEIKDYIKTFTYGSTIISFGWYLQLCLLIYIVFYLVFKFVKISKLRSLFIALFIVAYFAFYYINQQPVNLYTPLFFFAFGIICSRYREVIDKIISKFHILLFVVSIIIFVAGFLSVWRYGYLISDYVVPFIYIISGLAFLVFIIISVRFLLQHITVIVINPVSRFLGVISLELYAFQGMILRTLRIFDFNTYVYILLVFVSSVLVAFVTNKLLGLLQKKIFSK